jgi:hypothetical protein
VNNATFTNYYTTKTAPSLSLSILDNSATVAFLQMEAEEEQVSMSLSNELEHDEKTDWLHGCGWPC